VPVGDVAQDLGVGVQRGERLAVGGSPAAQMKTLGIGQPLPSMTPFTVLGVAGSLRHDSYNHALLRADAELAPDDVGFEIFDLHDVPLYDEDHDEYRGGDHMPGSVVALRDRIAAADAVVLACPEYNWGPSGVLKNAIDWASRPSCCGRSWPPCGGGRRRCAGTAEREICGGCGFFARALLTAHGRPHKLPLDAEPSRRERGQGVVRPAALRPLRLPLGDDVAESTPSGSGPRRLR
jgi:hypothetical protein